jgi:hypothetical protein
MCVCIASAYAVGSWTRSFTWTIASQSFQVYGDAGLTSLLPDLNITDVGIVAYSDVKSYTYWIKNDGTVPIVVAWSDVTVNGVLATWDKPNLSLAAGANGTLTLTLTNFENITDGSYVFEFNIL